MKQARGQPSWREFQGVQGRARDPYASNRLHRASWIHMVPLKEIRGPGARKIALKAFLALFCLLGLTLEGQEDQGSLKQLREVATGFFLHPGPPGRPRGLPCLLRPLRAL